MTKKQKTILNYILSGLTLTFCNAMFAVTGIIFLVSDFHVAAPIIAGIIFSFAPLFYCYHKGVRTGERDYKEASKLLPNSSKSNFAVADINIYKALYNLISFVAPLLITLLLGIILNNIVLHGICYFIFLHLTIIFFKSGIVGLNPITWWSLLIYLPYIIIVCAAFMAGYIIKIERLKNRQREIAGEIRMFNN